MRNHRDIAVGVDAGGSSTRASWIIDGRLRQVVLPSIVPASVGVVVASDNLRTCIREIQKLNHGNSLRICLAAAFMPIAIDDNWPTSLGELIREEIGNGIVLLVNDVVPLLFAPPMDGMGLVISSGTGSAVVSRVDRGVLVFGGYEYFLADSGSAFWIGLQGLRRAAIQWDEGKCQDSLCGAAVEHFGKAIPSLGRYLSTVTDAKAAIASFAPRVTSLAEDSDLEAQSIVSEATSELAGVVWRAYRRSGFQGLPRMLLAGSTLLRSDETRNKLLRQLDDFGLGRAVSLGDNLAAALWVAESLAHRATVIASIQSEVCAPLISSQSIVGSITESREDR